MKNKKMFNVDYRSMRIPWKTVTMLCIIAFGIRMAGCQFDITGNNDVNLLTVHLSPDSAAVPFNGQLMLTATVLGYQNDGGVSWVVDGLNSGTIVGTGLTAVYTAPGFRFTPYVTIRVIPNEDPTRYKTCSLYLYAPADVTPNDTAFTASPNAIRMLSGNSQQFTIDTVTFTEKIGAVTWTMISGPGSVSPSGIYASSGDDSDNTIAVIRATSVADPTIHSDAQIMLSQKTDSILCFTRDVLPIVSGSCGMSGCHDPGKRAGGYDYNSYAGMIKSVRPFNAHASRMYTACTQFNAASRMPPPPGQALSQTQMLAMGRWINDGALETVGSY